MLLVGELLLEFVELSQNLFLRVGGTAKLAFHERELFVEECVFDCFRIQPFLEFGDVCLVDGYIFLEHGNGFFQSADLLRSDGDDLVVEVLLIAYVVQLEFQSPYRVV